MCTFNKKKVIVFRVDSNDSDMYMVTLTEALLSLGHEVIVVRNRGLLLQNAHQNSVTLNVGTWIPISICGYFRSTMHFLRSAYTALWVSFYLQSAEVEPTIVFSDANAVAIPILRNIGRFRVICMEYYRELMTNFRPFNPDTAMASQISGHLQRLCMSSAELILVPCESVRPLLEIYEEDERVRVLYPPAEAEQTDIPVADGNNHIRRFHIPPSPLEQFALRNLFVFVAVGIYEPQSNFNILIEAFEMAVCNLEFLDQRCIQLEIIGICISEAHREYLRELIAQVAQLSGNIATLINLRSNVSFDELCIAYRRACAVLNANLRDLYVPSIIEALFHGRVVISVNSEFATEVLKNAVNGVIISLPSLLTNQEFYAEEFAYAIHKLLHDEGLTYMMIALAASDKYCRLHSFRNFISRINQFIRS